MVVDILTVAGSLFVAYWIYLGLNLGVSVHYSISSLATLGVALGVVFAFVLEKDNGYMSVGSLMRIRETERVLRTSFIVFSLTIILSFLLHELISRWVLGLFAPICLVAVIVQKQITEGLLAASFRGGVGATRAAIYGAGETGRRVFSTLLRSPRLGITPVACFDHNASMDGTPMSQAGYRRDGEILTVVGKRPTVEDLSALDVQVLIASIPSISRDEIDSLREKLGRSGITLVSVPLSASSLQFDSVYADLDGVLLSSFNVAHEHAFYSVSKRVIDILFSATILLLLLPLFLIIMLAVRLDSKGPIFFSQVRLGKFGKPFRIYKFRSMHMHAPQYAVSPDASTDWRITRVGRILRKTSFDELPQLFNVLLGDMSLVGPRPEMEFIASQYNERQSVRLNVTPGITGLWQLSSARNFAIHENLEYDLYYIQYRNIFMDVAILIHTLIFAIRGV